MTGGTPKNIVASVHQRLLNEARRTGRPFNELLQYYALERFLYRLSRSPHAPKFLLKGAMMLRAWRLPQSRPTMDIDLLGRTVNEAMVSRGLLNSRMKDFYDIWALCRQGEFTGAVLAEAIRRTFDNRGTAVVASPLALTPEFAADAGKVRQWQAFVRKLRLDGVPDELRPIVAQVAAFLGPVAAAVVAKSDPPSTWRAPGPWTS